MAVRTMEILALRRDMGLETARLDAGVACGKPEQLPRVIVRSASSQKRWQFGAHRVAVHTTCAKLRSRSSAISSGGDNTEPPHKDYDLDEVLEKVIQEEEKELSEGQTDTDSSPDSGASPFTPAEENTDGRFAHEEGEGPAKESLIMPSKAAAINPETSSSSIGTGLGASEQSALAADPVPSSGKRDWRVRTLNDGLNAIFENEGGNSVDDYKLRSHVFEESAIVFSTLKNQESSSVV